MPSDCSAHIQEAQLHPVNSSLSLHVKLGLFSFCHLVSILKMSFIWNPISFIKICSLMPSLSSNGAFCLFLTLCSLHLFWISPSQLELALLWCDTPEIFTIYHWSAILSVGECLHGSHWFFLKKQGPVHGSSIDDRCSGKSHLVPLTLSFVS